jgi:hypothetical protein
VSPSVAAATCSTGDTAGAWSRGSATAATSSSVRRSNFRDFLIHSFPETFSVPKRFANHMMVVADLEHGNADAVEDAVIAAWELQSGE